jgi:GNAT superfamily N-acetyltransferase
MVIGRLAIDASFQGLGIGTALLKDAVLRTVQAGAIAGIRAILVHAISVRAKRFYEKWGFISSPIDPMTLMFNLADAENTIAEES